MGPGSSSLVACLVSPESRRAVASVQSKRLQHVHERKGKGKGKGERGKGKEGELVKKGKAASWATRSRSLCLCSSTYLTVLPTNLPRYSLYDLLESKYIHTHTHIHIINSITIISMYVRHRRAYT